MQPRSFAAAARCRVEPEVQHTRRALPCELSAQLYRRALGKAAASGTARGEALKGVLALLAAGVGLHRAGALRRLA